MVGRDVRTDGRVVDKDMESDQVRTGPFFFGREFAGRVMDGEDVDLVDFDPVDEPVGGFDDLSNVIGLVFGDGAAGARKFGDLDGAFGQAVDDPIRVDRGIFGDEGVDRAELVSGVIRAGFRTSARSEIVAGARKRQELIRTRFRRYRGGISDAAIAVPAAIAALSECFETSS